MSASDTRKFRRLREKERAASIVAFAGGYPIRERSLLSGKCYVIGDTGHGERSLDEAIAWAERNPK